MNSAIDEIIKFIREVQGCVDIFEICSQLEVVNIGNNGAFSSIEVSSSMSLLTFFHVQWVEFSFEFSWPMSNHMVMVCCCFLIARSNAYFISYGFQRGESLFPIFQVIGNHNLL